MMVYRQQRRPVSARLLLDHVQQQLHWLRRRDQPSRDDLVCALIDAGEWASAVADARAVDHDSLDRTSDACLELVVHLASAADAAWDGRRADIGRALEHAGVAADRCARLALPSTVSLGVSEGFAYYAVGPELYAEAARAWRRRAQPGVAWCIGLRTIGLTLAATVAAALQHHGVAAHALSLRPRGHPFDRTLDIDPGLARALTSTADAWWLVIDEGPGISGSSMAGTARALAGCGVPAERIVLMPSYAPDLSRLADSARSEWQRHEVWPAHFDGTWVTSERLAQQWRAAALTDVAAGTWRDLTALETETPAVHPHHERRKYVVNRDSRTTLLKFVGYGRYGRTLTARATQAAAEGWAPAPENSRDGWIEFPWLRDRFGVVRASDKDVTRVGEYIAFIYRTRESTVGTPADLLKEMTVANVRAMCGDRAALAAEAMPPPAPERMVIVDGHMRPHEWVRCAGQLQKTDGVEHGDDHLFPGPCDIAWDLAGVIEEWGLDGTAASLLIERYVRASRDTSVVHRLPFYRLAYLAFRGGYTALAQHQLHGTPEATRFGAELARYRQSVEALVACAC